MPVGRELRRDDLIAAVGQQCSAECDADVKPQPVVKLRVALPLAIKHRPRNRGNGCYYQKTENFDVVIRGVTAAVGEYCDGLGQPQPMLSNPWDDLVPQELIPLSQFLRVGKSADRKRKAVQDEIAKSKTKGDLQPVVPLNRL